MDKNARRFLLLYSSVALAFALATAWFLLSPRFKLAGGVVAGSWLLIAWVLENVLGGKTSKGAPCVRWQRLSEVRLDGALLVWSNHAKEPEEREFWLPSDAYELDIERVCDGHGWYESKLRLRSVTAQLSVPEQLSTRLSPTNLLVLWWHPDRAQVCSSGTSAMNAIPAEDAESPRARLLFVNGVLAGCAVCPGYGDEEISVLAKRAVDNHAEFVASFIKGHD